MEQDSDRRAMEQDDREQLEFTAQVCIKYGELKASDFLTVEYTVTVSPPARRKKNARARVQTSVKTVVYVEQDPESHAKIGTV